MIDRFLTDLAAALSGPPRRRRRLLDEIAAHLEDAILAGIASGATAADAELAALDRLGHPRVIADRWNDHRRRFRAAQSRRLAVVALGAGAAFALGVTQYAAGKPRPEKTPEPGQRFVDLPADRAWSREHPLENRGTRTR